MGIPRVDYGYHFLKWHPNERKIEIYPKRNDVKVTHDFGLGNAIIRFNLTNPPQKIVVPITGESNGKGLIPTSPFELRRWFISVKNVSKQIRTLEGSNGTVANIEYPFAGEYYGEELRNDVDILKNGVGQWSRRYTERINW